jgi:hypothetical protein
MRVCKWVSLSLGEKLYCRADMVSFHSENLPFVFLYTIGYTVWISQLPFLLPHKARWSSHKPPGLPTLLCCCRNPHIETPLLPLSQSHLWVSLVTRGPQRTSLPNAPFHSLFEMSFLLFARWLGALCLLVGSFTNAAPTRAGSQKRAAGGTEAERLVFCHFMVCDADAELARTWRTSLTLQ